MKPLLLVIPLAAVWGYICALLIPNMYFMMLVSLIGGFTISKWISYL